MFTGINRDRILAMTTQERRWLDNVKKGFFDSDLAFRSGEAKDKCLEQLFKAIDTAKTLRCSLRGETLKIGQNKRKFIDFLALEIPAAKTDNKPYRLRDARTGNLRDYSLGEIIYDIRCMIHENENLNCAEEVDYHILLDWSVPTDLWIVDHSDEKFKCNGYALWNRLREVLAKFITVIDSYESMEKKGSCSVTIRPQIGTITDKRRSQQTESDSWGSIR